MPTELKGITQSRMADGRTRLEVNLSPRQGLAFQTLELPDVWELLYGGAKGGGKSVLGTMWIYAKAKALIQKFQIPSSKQPMMVGFMGRKRGVDFNDTTLETWKRFVPAEDYQIRITDKEIVVDSRVKIAYGGFDNEEGVAKFNSAEFAFAFVDQAEELTRDDVGILRGAMRLVINGQHPKYKILFTANPAQCWLKSEFIQMPKPFRRYVPALPGDNPYLDAEYKDRLAEAFSHRPQLLEAYLRGSWDALEGADQIIKDQWLRAARGRKLYSRNPITLIACDPARFGDDETVIFVMKDTDIISGNDHIYGQKSTMYTASKLAVLSRQHGDCPVAIDSIGVGGGIVDQLRELGVTVIAIDSASRSSNQKRHGNLRSEMWELAAKELSDGDIALTFTDLEFDGQVTTPRYEYRKARLYVEPKSTIKKRLNRSPDRAEAWIYGLHALRILRKQAEATEGVIVYRKERRAGRGNDMRTYEGRRQDYKDRKARALQAVW